MPLISTGFHLPYNAELSSKARALRNGLTRAEKRLWYEYLSKAPIRFLRQRPIGQYIVDFYCAKLKLVIEIDGESHMNDYQRQNDEQRTADLNRYGLRIIRFTNDEVLNRLDHVVARIEEEIRQSGNDRLSNPPRPLAKGDG